MVFTTSGTSMSSWPMTHAGEQRPHHRAEGEAADPQPADEEPQGQGEEDGEFRVLPEGVDEEHHALPTRPVRGGRRSEARRTRPGEE